MIKIAGQDEVVATVSRIRIGRNATEQEFGKRWLPGLEPADQNVKPFLRWAGGKTRLMQALLPHFPNRFKAYYEPFLGGGSVFFAIRRRATDGLYLSDLNTELVNVWRVVRESPDEFLKELRPYALRKGEEGYYSVREETPVGPIKRAARFFYLNQTSWNALWRVNRWGTFNVPWGAREFRGITRTELEEVTAVLRSTQIDEMDFRAALERPQKGDFVYLDPPYLPISDTSKFAGYTEQRFRKSSLAELATCCESLSARGVSWVMSNRDTTMVRELFDFGTVVALTTRRSVAAQNRRDVEPSASPEVIVISKGKSKA